MKIIAHRGFWRMPEEKNTEIAFQRAVDFDFGIETDVRDLAGNLVISHDSPSGGELGFEIFMNRFGRHIKDLALNVKSDGLASKFKVIVEKFNNTKPVFFDMSGPEHLNYRKTGLLTLNRVSEFERGYVFDEPDYGTWVDGFESDNWKIDWINSNRSLPNLYIVSPELHGRPHLDFWKSIQSFENKHGFLLCTDFPLEAKEFFGATGD